MDVSVSTTNLSKSFRMYRSPAEKFKELLHPRKKKYSEEFWALRNVSFDIQRGESFGIIGKNGAGKSTFLQILCGILQPTEGSIKVHGRIAALLDLGAGFNPDFTGRENVYMNGNLRGFSDREMDGKLDMIIDFADIGKFIEQPVKTYSSGMFVRLAFACAINVEPDILIVDEVLAVGDVFFRQKCHKRLQEMRDNGVTTVFVSHAMTDIQQICHRALLLERGEVAFLGSAADAVKRYYLIEQKRRESELAERRAARSDGPIRSAEFGSSDYFWPGQEAFLDLSHVDEISNGWARCTGVALCDSEGEACRVFQQGDEACFFYEFEILKDIEVPVGGIIIINEKNIIVHGKNSLQYDAEVPEYLETGERIRFRQDVKLDLAAGEYTFTFGLATMSYDDFISKALMPHAELETKVVRLSHISSAGEFSISMKRDWDTVQLPHHGICDLPGSCAAYLTAVLSAEAK